MNSLIVIPTYHAASGRSAHITPTSSVDPAKVLTVYDHMTPLAREGELARLLESLTSVHEIGVIAILVAAETGIEEEAEQKVQAIVDRFPTLNCLVIGTRELELMRDRMEELGFGRMEDAVSLTGYGAIRNTGLLITQVLGFDTAIFIDDDEVVADPAFLHKATYGLGKMTRKGVPIIAKSGYYYDARNSYLSPVSHEWYDRHWDQSEAFNDWIQGAMKGARLSRSNFICGGCLALHREAFKRLSFDPWIPRGEDLDYLLDLRMYGCDVWFDNEWSLRHLPPVTPNKGTRFCQDVYRWLYEYRKIEFSHTQIDLMQITPGSLEPYPGRFLEEDIAKRIRKTASLRALGCPEREEYRRARKLVNGEAEEYAAAYCREYFELTPRWQRLMAGIVGDQELSATLVESMTQRAFKRLDPGNTGELELGSVAE